MDPTREDLRSPLVGLVYDERMCRHATPDGESHPENAERIRAIWKKLDAEGIPQRCIMLHAKEAEDTVISNVHTMKYIKLIRNISSKGFDSRRPRVASKFNSIYLNRGSTEAAYLAAGSVIEATEKVAKGDLNSAIAIVRPPGHHAEANEAMGFCLFNNVAIAASYLLNNRVELGFGRILIVDWDVHHGNGTQNMFYRDPRVLYFSVHRFDFGSFYPTGGDGSYCMIGEDQGAGYNINVPWEHGQCGDADYIAVWDHVLIPVAEAYNPDIILISAGFDAAMGDPLGGCCITPYGYSMMLKKLMKFADGKIVLALEGGYNLVSIADSVLACAKTLLEGEFILGNLKGKPFESTWRVIKVVREELKAYWPVFTAELHQEIPINAKPCQMKIESNFNSDSDVEKNNELDTITVQTTSNVENVILSLSHLNIGDDTNGDMTANWQLSVQQNIPVPSNAGGNPNEISTEIRNRSSTWRSALSSIDVWYGSYGSNMWKPRFLCYIEGGKIEGMNKPCQGAIDKSLPKSIFWMSVPHRLFFARSHSNTWGAGGVTFLHPRRNMNEKTYICAYRITLEQFNDVLVQENSTSEHFESPLIDSLDLDLLVKNKSMAMESLMGDWYSNVLYLGEKDDIPILTMTCTPSEAEKYESGDLPVSPPPNDYQNILLKGLAESKILSTEEAISYLTDAATRKL
ncbi:Histone deacetylase 5 [Apostasia shenzhenica]|uniref:histone deacetylase n=1 Tax=Apostasia shenzhenica TaxID=1088818 RepID=A0A2I0AWD0_9ASPA|nr:Histone deacetylase 5 [Apostasia shenzhenica]